MFEREGRTWLVFGAYDHRIHFVDAATGEDIIPPFPTGDIAKGAITVDPDGYPLIYAGSRDNHFRVISFDGPEPVELWSIDGRRSPPASGTTIGTVPPSWLPTTSSWVARTAGSIWHNSTAATPPTDG